MALKKTNFIRGAESQRGLPGYLNFLFPKYGTATVANGTTSIDVADTLIAAGDLVLAAVLTKGANACYVTEVGITAGTKFTVNVNTDPGAGGVVVAFIVLRPTS